MAKVTAAEMIPAAKNGNLGYVKRSSIDELAGILYTSKVHVKRREFRSLEHTARRTFGVAN